MPTIVCPYCEYSGGPDYSVRQGFTYAELSWHYYDVEAVDGRVNLIASSLNTDPEQEVRDKKLECGGCGELFDVPDGLELEWV